MSRQTMLDIAKLNGNDPAIGIIEEAIKACPEIALFPARQVKGVSYTTVRRTGRPTVGFRKANGGNDATKSTFAKDTHEMFILSGRIEVDKAVADAQEGGPSAMQADETVAIGQSTLEAVGSQVWYGVSANAAGFAGLEAITPASRITKSDCTSGATGKTSAYFVRYGVSNGVSFDLGNNSTIQLSDFRVETIYDTDGKPLPGYVADLSGWMGLSVKTVESIMRICNIGTETGKLGISDKIIAAALSAWKGAAPDALYMNRTAAFLLQCSRTFALAGTGKIQGNVGPFAPMPTESNGIPIVITDSLVDTETFVS